MSEPINKSPQPLMDALMFIRGGLSSGRIKSKPIIIQAPGSEEWPMQSLTEYIDDAVEKSGYVAGYREQIAKMDAKRGKRK